MDAGGDVIVVGAEIWRGVGGEGGGIAPSPCQHKYFVYSNSGKRPMNQWSGVPVAESSESSRSLSMIR